MGLRSLISRRQPAPVGVDLFIRRRRRRKWYVLAGLVFVLALSWADRQNLFGGADDDLARYDGKTFVVTHIVDGDTLDIDTPDATGKGLNTRIRLWGINAPEMPHHGREIEPFAREATDYLRQRADRQRVTLTLERHRIRDVYGRLLAFVSFQDGATVNEELVAAGLARADGRWEHRHLQRYAMLEEQARRDGAGMWAATKKPPFQPRSSASKNAASSRPATKKNVSPAKPVERPTAPATAPNSDAADEAFDLQPSY